MKHHPKEYRVRHKKVYNKNKEYLWGRKKQGVLDDKNIHYSSCVT